MLADSVGKTLGVIEGDSDGIILGVIVADSVGKTLGVIEGDSEG